MVKVKQVKQTIYNGHPHQFWKLRQQKETENLLSSENLKKASDEVEYDFVHRQKAIINRVAERVTEILKQEEINLRHRKEKLKNLLNKEETEFRQEIAFIESMKICEYCTKKKQELVKHNEQKEKDKIIECRKALEREKIAKGQQYTKADELKLRQIQKMQMIEKKNIGQEQRTMDKMWHQMMLQEIKYMKEKEEYEAQLSKHEMQKRRKAYDTQISSANRQRRELLENERELETKRLKQMKERMEEEYLEALKKKRQQMQENKKNYLQGHEMKMNRLKYEKELEKDLDLKNIQVSNEEVHREKRNKQEKMRQLQKEKQIFIDHLQMEKNISNKLNKETELLLLDLRKKQDDKDFIQFMKHKEETMRDKQEAQKEYKQYVDARNMELDRKRQKRIESMESVKRTALQELQRNMDSANEELKKQIEYRRKLTQQIYENKKVKEREQTSLDQKQLPFTRKATTFKDAMINKLNNLSLETPGHPFAKLMTSNEYSNTMYLPSLDNTS